MGMEFGNGWPGLALFGMQRRVLRARGVCGRGSFGLGFGVMDLQACYFGVWGWDWGLEKTKVVQGGMGTGPLWA